MKVLTGFVPIVIAFFVDFVYFNCVFTVLIMFNTRKSHLATDYSILVDVYSCLL